LAKLEKPFETPKNYIYPVPTLKTTTTLPNTITS